jgi:hypothetical protein
MDFQSFIAHAHIARADERSAPLFPEERRQTVLPGYSQSGEARAVAEVRPGIGELLPGPSATVF